MHRIIDGWFLKVLTYKVNAAEFVSWRIVIFVLCSLLPLFPSEDELACRRRRKKIIIVSTVLRLNPYFTLCVWWWFTCLGASRLPASTSQSWPGFGLRLKKEAASRCHAGVKKVSVKQKPGLKEHSHPKPPLDRCRGGTWFGSRPAGAALTLSHLDTTLLYWSEGDFNVVWTLKRVWQIRWCSGRSGRSGLIVIV